jgi:ABC-2 type transport system permease protein
MRADVAPGATLPDYELPDHTNTRRRLSELQGNDPMILVLARGLYCPKCREQHRELVALHTQIAVAYTQIVTTTTEDVADLNAFRDLVGAQWTFLSDAAREVQRDLAIQESPPLGARQLPLHARERLLPARPVGRLRRPLRLRRARARHRGGAAAQERRMTEALRAEWTTLRTLASTRWLLIGAVALTVALSVGVDTALHLTADSRQDPTKLSLTGIDVGQAVIAVLAVLAISDEYATGMIRITLTAVPRRLTPLTAKAANIAAHTFVAGLLAVAGCLLAGRLMLPGAGLDAAHGYALVSISHGPTLRAAFGSVLYLTLIALLSLGVATAIRDTAVSIGLVLGLLYVLPILAQAVADPMRRHLQQIAPMTAGLAIQATTNLHSQPLTPWAGLGVLAAWTTGALLAGSLSLRTRDA